MSLKPEEKKTLRFSLGKDELSYWSGQREEWMQEAEASTCGPAGIPVRHCTLHSGWFPKMKILCSTLLAASIALAQMPPRTPADAVKSPEVLPDHRVTFRLYAPNAKEVAASGDWRTVDTASTGKMDKDERGVWSLTIGPLRPDFYTYSFSVDGQPMPDPKNVNLKVGVASLQSIVGVPGEEAEFEAERRVPHGAVNMIWYLSSTLDRQRRLHVYTPPGYETGREKYPVLYLIHGGGDNDSDWTSIGRANFILDNLLADKKIPPMIVVMPDGSTARAAIAPIFRPGGRGGPEAGMAGDRFGDDLMGDIIPYVDGHYRTLATRDKRALAGLSMGGLQVLWFGLPEFREVCLVWSLQLRAEVPQATRSWNEWRRHSLLTRGRRMKW